MKRTPVTLPVEMVEALGRAARRGHTSIYEVVRRLLAARLGVIAGGERPLPFADLCRSGGRHVARNMEPLRAEGWTPDRDPRCPTAVRGGRPPSAWARRR